tara:strand:+ start:275 stop:523 length:249 start_codon:yes stop_codon:yes gene_type:complete
MSRVVVVRGTKFLLPSDPINQDIFIGLWLNAQKKAINKVMEEQIFKDYSVDEFDEKIDEYTLIFYKQIKIGGDYVYRRELET